jgi:hypothetical protein
MEQTRTCSRCEVEKQIEEFYPDPRYVGGRMRICKECMRIASADYRQRNPDYSRRKSLKSECGITLEQYDEMLKAQGGVCAICKKSERTKTNKGEVRALAVDHDHETGHVRGLLCGRCNRALGTVESFFPLARDYLRW